MVERELNPLHPSLTTMVYPVLGIVDVSLDRKIVRSLSRYPQIFDYLDFVNEKAQSYLDKERSARPEGYDWDHLDEVADFAVWYLSRNIRNPGKLGQRDAENLLIMSIAGKCHDLVKGKGGEAHASADIVREWLEGTKGNPDYNAKLDVNYVADRAVKLIADHETYKSMRLQMERLKELTPEPDLWPRHIKQQYADYIRNCHIHLGLAEDETLREQHESFSTADTRARAIEHRIILVGHGYLNNPQLYSNSDKPKFNNIDQFLDAKFFKVRPPELENFDPIVKEAGRIYEESRINGDDSLNRRVEWARKASEEERIRKLGINEKDKPFYKEIPEQWETGIRGLA